MDPIENADMKRRRKPPNQGKDSDENESESSEEEANQTFFEKLSGFLFFGCGGTSKR